jgi:drug/metabolite transporter (DMT)-like permease
MIAAADSQRVAIPGRAFAMCLLVAANLLWAGQGVAVKLLKDGLGPVAIALLPLYVATALGFGLMSVRGRLREQFALAWEHRREFVLAGVCGQCTAQLGMTIGVKMSLASNGAILSMLIPILTAVIATLLLREKLLPLRVAALLLGVAGAALLSPIPSRTTGVAGGQAMEGTFLIALGCLGSAFYNVYSKRLLEQFSGADVLFFSYLAATIFSLPLLMSVETQWPQELMRLSRPEWAAFGYLAIFLYGVSMVIFFRALRHVEVMVASMSLYLVPVFGVILAAVMLGERLAGQAIVGSAIVLLATVLLFCFDGAASTKADSL